MKRTASLFLSFLSEKPAVEEQALARYVAFIRLISMVIVMVIVIRFIGIQIISSIFFGGGTTHHICQFRFRKSNRFCFCRKLRKDWAAGPKVKIMKYTN